MNVTSGKTKVCGLIGNPVEHTLSPIIHNHLANHFGHDLIYVPFLVEGGQLETAIKGAKALHIHGMNVTVPYKSEVMSCLVKADELALKIGAVNTLVSLDGGFCGYNTDMSGLLRAMQTDGITLFGEEIILLGAGGAARAVAYLCANSGAKRVYLFNRTLEKAKILAQEVNTAFASNIICPMEYQDYSKLANEKYIAIQATSVGLHPNTEIAPIEEVAFYQKIKIGYDLIYKPFETKFMRLTREAGGVAFNGLKMLLYQGIIAYELWNNVTVTQEVANDIEEQMRKEIGSYA